MKINAAVAGVVLLAPIRAIHERIGAPRSERSMNASVPGILHWCCCARSERGARIFVLVLLCALGTGLAGCLSMQDVPPREYYVLDDLAPTGATKPGAAAGRVLLINLASASPFYDTQNLVFSRAPGQRAYYQFAGWTERPGRRLTELLMRRLEARGGFGSVAATTAGVKGDLVLNTRLEEFYHDASTKPGSVRIDVSAELVDITGRTIAAQRRFVQGASSAGESAQDAVAAFNRATTALLDEMSAWVESAARQPAVR
ncbi:MAG: ABC-type transport auxiliary lipoprotein family protein [Burkholderiales bacterium]